MDGTGELEQDVSPQRPPLMILLHLLKWQGHMRRTIAPVGCFLLLLSLVLVSVCPSYGRFNGPGSACVCGMLTRPKS